MRSSLAKLRNSSDGYAILAPSTDVTTYLLTYLLPTLEMKSILYVFLDATTGCVSFCLKRYKPLERKKSYELYPTFQQVRTLS